MIFANTAIILEGILLGDGVAESAVVDLGVGIIGVHAVVNTGTINLADVRSHSIHDTLLTVVEVGSSIVNSVTILNTRWKSHLDASNTVSTLVNDIW